MTHAATLGATTGQVATGAVSIGGGIATAAAAAAHAAWVPLVGPIIAGVTLALGLIFSRKGPQQKVATTKIVDSLEPLLKLNLQGYMDGPRTKESQAAALKNFDDAWAYLTSSQACGSSELGEPGQRCINDRKPGGQWDWFAYYRDPIANDPTPLTQTDAGAIFSAAGIPGEMLIAGACLAIALMI